MANEMVLLYHFTDQEMIRKVKFTMVRCKVKMRVVEYKDYNKSIGEMCVRSADNSKNKLEAVDYDGADMDAPMMVMKDFSSSKMDALLLGLRKAGVPRIDYKAVVTEHNVNWDGIKLYGEIKEEHEKMQGMK